MANLDTRSEASRRFHLALSFVRWFTPEGERRKAPLSSDMILRQLLTKNSYDRPSQRDDMKNAIFRNDLSEDRATVLTNKIRKNAMLPEELMDLLGEQWTPGDRAKNTKLVLAYYDEHYPEAHTDFAAWEGAPKRYAEYADGIKERTPVTTGQSIFGGALLPGHPKQRDLVASTTGTREKQ